MTPERWEQITAIFHAALARDAAERDGFLTAKCVDDSGLRREVESMLAAHDEAGSFGEPPARGVARASRAESSASHPTLSVGSRLGPYDILSLLGVGGMGEVYRAHDGRLHRDVALKVLLPAVANDPDRLARFAREARVLASLDHPNIAHVHGLEEADGVRALVMELVEGPTLADRIARGAIPVDEALEIARQIAGALEGAHARDIIHRDLKPANIKVRPDGTVKVLDFGLAKALAHGVEHRSKAGATVPGVILGTAAYMAPEQAKGKPVDRRTDLWALGCVLFEMLTGRRAFDGDALPDVLVRVLEYEPDWQALPAKTPASIRTLLRRCLEKDPRRRLDSAAAARLEIDDAATASDGSYTTPRRIPAPSRNHREWIAWSVAATSIVMLMVGGLAYYRTASVQAPGIAFTIPLQENSSPRMPLDPFATVSPDGRHIAFTMRDRDSPTRLSVRSLDFFEAQVLPGTEGAFAPFWSPDSSEIAFFTTLDGQLKAVGYAGGPVRVVCPAPAALGGTWNREGTILFSTAATSGYAPTSVPVSGLHRVSAAGGVSTPIIASDQSGSAAGNGFRLGARARWPHFLPDGRHFLYLRQDSKTIYLGTLDSNESTPLLKADSQAIYSAPGYLLFVRGGTLMGQAFAPRRLELRGEPFRIAENVRFEGTLGGAVFSTSDDGVLAYSTGANQGPSRAAWFDRTGRALTTLDLATISFSNRLSPDGSRLVQERWTPGDVSDVWIRNLTRGSQLRVTSSSADEESPIWSPDGTHIVYASNLTGMYDLYRIAATGSGHEEVLYRSPQDKQPNDWSTDGRFIAFTAFSAETRGDIWLLDLSGERSAVPLVNTMATESQPRFSPTGNRMAFRSDRTGRHEIYIQPLPSGPPIPVSVDGGSNPFWRHDGEELFFVSADNWLMAVDGADINGAGFQGQAPRRLFELPARCFQVERCIDADITRDGRFLVVTADAEEAPIRVLFNWMSLLSRSTKSVR